MTQGLTKSNPGLCQVRPCEHEHPSCLESSLELEPDTHPLNSEHTLSVPEISQHKGLARQERAARTTDSFNVQKYGSAKSMRRMVPAEIWDTIFCYAIYDYSLTLRNRTLNSLALKFSQVCAPWRAVVIGSPSLWSSISIDLSSFSSKMTVTLQMYLKRSEGRLLNLWISLSRDRVECLGNARDAWRLLAPHLSRCRTLVWDVDDVKLLPEVYNLAFPNLVSFQDWHFRIVDVNGLALPPDWFWTAASSAPQLSRVAFNIPLPLSWLPYSNLVSLNARYVCMFSKIFFHVLPKCAALRSSTVGSLGIDDGNTSQLAVQDSIEIPSLRHLAVDDEYSYPASFNRALTFLCLNFRLPNLTSCSVHASECPSSISDICQQCSATLERLEITLKPYDPKHTCLHPIIASLRHTPHLTHFELSVSKLGNSSFETASVALLLSRLRSLVEPDGNPYLPRLQSLHLHFPGLQVTTTEVEMVLDVATKRSAADTTCALTRLRLTSAGSCTLDDIARERVRQLREHGVWVIFDD